MLQFETEVEIGTILHFGETTVTVVGIENDEVHFRVESIDSETNPECEGNDFTLPPK